MRRITIFLLLLCLPIVALGQSKKQKKEADKQTAAWRYEIESVTVGVAGSCVVKVWSFSANPNVAMEQAKKNAVHGVIFKGIPAKERVPGRKALVTESAKERENEEFFKSFFANNGDYMRYVTLTNSGAIASGDVVKLSKKEYKVGVVVTISYDELRNLLEREGVAKRLDAGF